MQRTIDELVNAYVWELEFADGIKLSRTDWLAVPKEARLDPNNPGKQVIMVRLIPQFPDYAPLWVRVPDGALPVAIREPQKRQGITLFNIVFKIGFNLHRIRHMICVSTNPYEMYQSIDNGGCPVVFDSDPNLS